VRRARRLRIAPACGRLSVWGMALNGAAGVRSHPPAAPDASLYREGARAGRGVAQEARRS
jgi:hypothetical protein